ncbi:MAG: TetR/AcrR family transcriptional regulator [Yaniella sp.]|uniref:TetR/AcrR family transcriptional regulator n=1 Tax=Yaniella sp. TaxID=2773929 RepID=UPI002648682E|nr:TetR/AcrR family transcriptional regulator [Yaniella sp.]MDN5704159.1 TetR/AcrR family transcriptional regulator [Yaniella sp.]MDN5731494.1 TetR/AcrR family transcriptional regulator [Yaniella sp.]MDN5742460.1 TetR/AcrR family transcriptional regulator [Yaniella sp.]MDN5815367.1 TetR/AcrR family transcriptional regulator [Yaniella sp.]MDN5817029.1 TetR/AcrR family transcriptional regulator [Yaniella sp.]
MKSQRDLEKIATQARIVDAALQLFETTGYETTSMARIARDANTSRANLYLHFTSKSQIVLHRMRSLEPEVLALYNGLDTVSATHDCVKDWLRQAGQLWLRHLTEFDAISRAMTTDDEVFQEWLDLHHRISAQLADRLPAGAMSGARREVHLVTLMISLEQNFYFLYVRGRRDREELVLNSLATQWLTLLT